MAGRKNSRIPRAVYERELLRLQAELVKLQEWVRHEGARLVVVFEGRDAAARAARSNASPSTGGVLGSTGNALLEHAACPVVVVH